MFEKQKTFSFVFGDQSVFFVSTEPKAFNNNLEIRSVGMPFLKPEYCFSFLSIYRDNSRKSFLPIRARGFPVVSKNFVS